MRYRPRLSWLVWLAAALALGGCQFVPERTPVAFYDLPAQPLTNSPSSAAPVDATLRLATPRATGLLDGTRILVVPQPNRPQVYAGARWADTMPLLLRDRLLDAFHDDGRLPGVVHEDSGATADVELHSDLRSFHSEYRSGHPEAVIRLDVRLIDARTQHLLASQRFLHYQRADSESIDHVVDAFGTAADRLAQELVDWSVMQMRER
ncbi:ABC-type transport auxiliary lipoprotein family protein [Halomonas sp. KM-1]|jgi:cholesterol transport system auxiliary component|uniref:ABC-type transport auxiliary lipoprotein family protein n=1 Tax=Halomonas sp. KM-1 TaxID=590061 RepID=UPI000289BC71|nr:ABC-type transport auxiliary lipoprotein family protein [Halomonas sp. KM-1]